MSNGLRFAHAGGRGAVRCGAVDRAPLGRAIRVTVKDDGDGTRPGELDAIVAHLAPGPGPAFHLLRRLVELQGGTVGAGIAATRGGMPFCVTLPMLPVDDAT